MRKFNKVAIIGVGEIGGSIGKDLKRKKLAGEVIGVGRRKSSLAKAKKTKAVDRVTLSLENGIKDADFIILATPVIKIAELGKKVLRFAKKDAIITDAGSTKAYIEEKLGKRFAGKARFVGSHPMAGSEKDGPLSAKDNLFKDRVCFVTKTKKTDKKALAAVKSFWKSLGSKVIEISPATHDEIVAQISHMVHIVASSLVISNKGVLKHAASGFRDATRIALADAVLWKDICVTNSGEIVKSLDKLIKILKKFKFAISKRKISQVQNMLSQARLLRRTIK